MKHFQNPHRFHSIGITVCAIFKFVSAFVFGRCHLSEQCTHWNVKCACVHGRVFTYSFAFVAKWNMYKFLYINKDSTLHSAELNEWAGKDTNDNETESLISTF